VSVSDLINDMKDLLDRALGPGVRVAQDLPGDLPLVLIDRNQLELALLNLSVNARDAMPDGGTLIFRADRTAHSDPSAPTGLLEGDYVRLSVIDDGVGMDEPTLAHATEPFFTTKGVGKGTGLGLSMVHGLAAQSGGALRLSSGVGEGSRADLWIPVVQQKIDGGAQVNEGSSIENLCSTPHLNVLVVDDDALVSSGTAAMLEDLGHSVVEAGSAIEALGLFERGLAVDLVITDHAMPEMTGMELARRLSKIRPELRVILATGYADLPPAQEPCQDLPRLSKPFLQGDLARAITECAPDRISVQ
jgi:CheY-like chemotaxis protein